MQPDIIREIAEAIVQDQLLLNWRFYALICTLSLIASATSNLLASYFKRRGETYATKADMDEILRQLHDTTRVTEEVRSAVSHADWAAREWRTTRRLKLEELLASAYEIDQWFEIQRSKWVHHQSVVSDAEPMRRLKIITNLYFPELQDEAIAVWLTHLEIYKLFLAISSRTKEAEKSMDINDYRLALDVLTEKYEPMYLEAHKALLALESKASILMAEVAKA